MIDGMFHLIVVKELESVKGNLHESLVRSATVCTLVEIESTLIQITKIQTGIEAMKDLAPGLGSIFFLSQKLEE